MLPIASNGNKIFLSILRNLRNGKKTKQAIKSLNPVTRIGSTAVRFVFMRPKEKPQMIETRNK
jgi:hypothetical protein